MGTKLYKPGKGLSTDIVCEVKKTFTDLTDDELLKKCLHGTTQNRNESFNAMIWKRIPKVTYVGLSRKRLFNAVYKDKPEVKKSRKIITAKAKGKADKTQKKRRCFK